MYTWPGGKQIEKNLADDAELFSSHLMLEVGVLVIESVPYCKPANISVHDIIANLAWQASRYLIQHTIEYWKGQFKSFPTVYDKPVYVSFWTPCKSYMVNIGMSYTVGKLLASHYLIQHASRARGSIC